MESKNKYDWLNKKTPRSVDQLRLWPENPRLNPEETHVSLSDYAEDFTIEMSDRNDFFDLIKSIAEDGFIPADPIVVWKNVENGKYYVAEGNRRVVALKLLRDPHKAPKSIRSFIRNQSTKASKHNIEKILVNVAPSFEDAEWYINQRNSTSSLQRKWSRVQQQRWISELYEKYVGDIDKISSISKLSKGGLEEFIRILKIKDFIHQNEVKSNLSEEEFNKANSYRFPITILERFFASKDVRDKWGIELEGINVRINSNKQSFYAAYTELIKRIINKTGELKIDTRTITSHLEEILESLPDVILNSEDPDTNEPEPNSANPLSHESIVNDITNDEPAESKSIKNSIVNQNLKGDPNRNKLVLSIYTLNTDSYRLAGLFDEFKKVSFAYKNSIAAGLRIFLDLAILKYIETEALELEMKRHYRSELQDIPLKRRLEYIKTNKLSGKTQNIASRLIDPSQQYSLDVLNGYIHGQDTHYLNKQFLNGFWDFLFPLFQILLDIKEDV